MFSIPNLSAQMAEPCVPWLIPHPGYPEGMTKAGYNAWVSKPETQHTFFSAFEGEVPSVRASLSSNPPKTIHGLVLDYDAVVDDLSVIALNATLSPTWVSHTFSGNARVVFAFAEPVPFCNPTLAASFLDRASKELHCRKLLPGWEETALQDYAKYYELGWDWTQTGVPIPPERTRAWLLHVSNKINWIKSGTGPSIPVGVIREEAALRWPGRWPGGWERFDLGVRGVRFWDDSASNPSGAMVRETGMQFFTNGGGFLSWAQIFGNEFVREWEQERLGGAVGAYWFDTQSYWRKLPAGSYQALMKSDVILDLRVAYGLVEGRKGVSEVDQAIHAIQTQRAVIGAAPFVYRPDGLIEFNGHRWLNTSKTKVVQPAQQAGEWAVGFPWLAEYFETLFDPADQLDYFISWLAHFYRAGLAKKPQRGLALFIAGPVGIGKTLLNKGILGQLMGGKEDAAAYLQTDDKFNDKLFGAALWTVDDAVAGTTARDRALFSQMVKKIVANDTFTYRPMFRSGAELPWVGRIVVTMNDDPESLQMLPEVDINILDKIMLLKACQPSVTTWPDDVQVLAELPYLGAFLRDFDIPAHCKGGARFSIVPYRHASLMQAAASLSVASSFEEMLDIWRAAWFAGPGEDAECWDGNPTDLLGDMMLNELIRENVKSNFSSATAIGMHLAKLVKRNAPGIATPSYRRYRIFRKGP